MRAVVLLLSAVFASAVSGAVIEVSPGPGTPLQDGIGAADPGDKVVVHAGGYTEAIVIDKVLRLAADGPVEIGPELGLGASSCAPAFVMDITAAGRVTVDGSHGALVVRGGGTAAVRMGGGARVKMVRVNGYTFCPQAAGLDVRDVVWAKVSKSGFGSFSTAPTGGPGCRVVQQGKSNVSLTAVRCEGLLGASGNYYGGAGLLVDGAAAGPRARVKIVNGPLISCGDAGANLQAATGVRIQKAYIEACPLILGGPRYFGLMLDAASTGNAVLRSRIAGPIQDLGTGNCFRGNIDLTDVPLPDGCS